MLLESPHRSDPSVKMPIAEANTTRVPNRSATQPLTGNEDREAQRVAREHRLHAERHDVQRRAIAGRRRVEDGRVERLHEERDRDEPRQEPLAPCSPCCRESVGFRDLRHPAHEEERGEHHADRDRDDHVEEHREREARERGRRRRSAARP
jgi:hypothetical protein